MNRNGWIGKVLLALAILVPLLGMAASIYAARSDRSLAIFSSNDNSQEEAYFLTAADFPESLETGNKVGDRVPDFNLELADGSSVTSASMVASGRPTYLFFWATI